MGMRVETLGQGEPRLAIVGAIHGDEPCGAQAIETLLDERPPLRRPVKCIIANEAALARGERYVDVDMNRGFPGSPTAEAHERRLAAQLLNEIQGCLTLSLHSTQSDDRPFAIVKELSPAATAICPYLSVEHVVETGDCIEDALVHHTPVIEIECGRQESKQATENAVQLVQEFLAVTGAWSQSSVEKSVTSIYRLQNPIPKERPVSCAVHVENFEAVPVGTPFASLDDTAITAEETFYPVLLSADGYETQFGYTATLTGTLG